MFKFKVADEVIVTAGRDKGKKGKIEKVLEKENKIVVAGVNLYKRHKDRVFLTLPGQFRLPVLQLSVRNVQSQQKWVLCWKVKPK